MLSEGQFIKIDRIASDIDELWITKNIFVITCYDEHVNLY
jgi:hypothetical protein